MTASSMPLARFKVLDLTRVRAGPTCVRQLADWGAQVIKIEAPPSPGEGLGGPRLGPDFQNLHRNKRSLTLDLKSPDGLEIFRKLVRDADVVVENYRPDVKERLGIDYNALKAINPRLVYASISGFGQSGPYRGKLLTDGLEQYDSLAEALGLVHLGCLQHRRTYFHKAAKVTELRVLADSLRSGFGQKRRNSPSQAICRAGYPIFAIGRRCRISPTPRVLAVQISSIVRWPDKGPEDGRIRDKRITSLRKFVWQRDRREGI